MSKQNLTRIVGVLSGILVLMATLVAQGQSPLVPNTPMTVTLGESPAWLSLTGNAGDVITLTTLTAITSTAPDTTLEILYPDGRRLDYNDDTRLLDGSFKTDASLQAITLPVDGDYRVRVDSFNGVSEGTVDVLLTYPDDAPDILAADTLTIVRGSLANYQTFSYPLDNNGSPLTITVRDTSGTLDPIVRIYDASGHLLAFNDDHGTDDVSLNVLDARISAFTAPEGASITVTVHDYLGQSGTLELIISS